MKRRIMTIIAGSALAIFPTAISAQSPECQGMMLNTKAVALAAPRSGYIVNFTGSGGQLDPVPLLETNITVVGSPKLPTCVVVTFSAQADPTDNYGVYQASIDNVPMYGHATLAESGLTTPIVFDATQQSIYLPLDGYRFLNTSTSRMVSYKFFAAVGPGVHTIRIRIAGCCSPAPIGHYPGPFVRAATLVAAW